MTIFKGYWATHNFTQVIVSMVYEMGTSSAREIFKAKLNDLKIPPFILRFPFKHCVLIFIMSKQGACEQCADITAEMNIPVFKKILICAGVTQGWRGKKTQKQSANFLLFRIQTVATSLWLWVLTFYFYANKNMPNWWENYPAYYSKGSKSEIRKATSLCLKKKQKNKTCLLPKT